MFTGIVEEVGTVKKISCNRSGYQLFIEADKILSDSKIGDSVSVNGTCLTIININNNIFSVDVSNETIKKTTFSKFKVDDRTNLERALKLGDRFGGHIVTGHVDGIAIIKKIDKSKDIKMLINAPKSILRYVIYKGSVTVDGISLTVSEIWNGGFSVSLIPHTVNHTTIRTIKGGDCVNIECDMLGKYVETFIYPFKDKTGNNNRITHELLTKHGYK